MKTTNVEIMDTYVKTSISKHGFEVQNIETKIASHRYELEADLENKMYPKPYYSHQLRVLHWMKFQQNSRHKNCRYLDAC